MRFSSRPQHLGGIHTGCAVSGIIWITYKVVNTYRNLVNENNAILVVGLLTNVTLIITAVAAFPWVRNTHHKYVFTASFSSLLANGSRVASSSATTVSQAGLRCF